MIIFPFIIIIIIIFFFIFISLVLFNRRGKNGIHEREKEKHHHPLDRLEWETTPSTNKQNEADPGIGQLSSLAFLWRFFSKLKQVLKNTLHTKSGGGKQHHTKGGGWQGNTATKERGEGEECSTTRKGALGTTTFPFPFSVFPFPFSSFLFPLLLNPSTSPHLSTSTFTLPYLEKGGGEGNNNPREEKQHHTTLKEDGTSAPTKAVPHPKTKGDNSATPKKDGEKQHCL